MSDTLKYEVHSLENSAVKVTNITCNFLNLVMSSIPDK